MPVAITDLQALMVRAHQKGASAAEADHCYRALFDQCVEAEKEIAPQDRVELCGVWAMGLAGYSKLKMPFADKQKLLEEAHAKFEVAMQGCEDKFAVFANSGTALLAVGEAAQSASEHEKASVYFTQSCTQFRQAFMYRQDAVDMIRSWRRALLRHSEMTTGHAKMWFDTQIAEKDRWLELLRNNEIPIKPEKMELSPPEKLYKGIEEKEKGNERFKKGELSEAIRYYHVALSYANGLYGLSAVDEKVLNELKVSVYNNMSMVHQKQGKPDKAIADLNLVLNLDADNLKACFRRGKLYLSLGELEKARADLERAKALSPSDTDIARELQALVVKEKQQAEVSRRVYSKMFG